MVRSSKESKGTAYHIRGGGAKIIVQQFRLCSFQKLEINFIFQSTKYQGTSLTVQWLNANSDHKDRRMSRCYVSNIEFKSITYPFIDACYLSFVL